MNMYEVCFADLGESGNPHTDKKVSGHSPKDAGWDDGALVRAGLMELPF